MRKPKPDPRRTSPPLGARISVSDDGFSLSLDEDLIAKVRWQDAIQVTAFSQVREGHVALCLVFYLPDGPKGREEHVAINQNLPGWQDLVAALPRAYPGHDSEWVRKARVHSSVLEVNISDLVPLYNANPVQIWPCT